MIDWKQLSDSNFDGNCSPMWIYDQETFRFLAVNDAAIHLYGYSRREFLRMTILDIRPSEEIAKLLTDTLRPDRRHESLEEHWRHATKRGEVIDVAVSSWEIVFDERPAELVSIEHRK